MKENALAVKIARKIWKQFDGNDYKPQADHVLMTVVLIERELKRAAMKQKKRSA